MHSYDSRVILQSFLVVSSQQWVDLLHYKTKPSTVKHKILLLGNWTRESMRERGNVDDVTVVTVLEGLGSALC